MSLSAQIPITSDASGALQRFLKQAEAVFPALAGKPVADGQVEPGCVVTGRDNRRIIADLLRFWQQQCPEAGEPYWSVRTWTMLVWQPVFLAVIAAHGARLHVDVSRLQQQRSGGLVAGFYLPATALLTMDDTGAATGADMRDAAGRDGAEAALIQRAAASVRDLADALFAELASLVRLKPLSARRLLADGILGAVMRLDQLQPGMSCSQRLATGQRWLEAAGLAGESGLIVLPLKDGRTGLGLDRKACCMHYRRNDGDLCASCPKLKRPERLRRMEEELYVNADAG